MTVQTYHQDSNAVGSVLLGLLLRSTLSFVLGVGINVSR